MITVDGKANIKATVVCDSISETGIRLLTFEIEVPRIVWSEFMTHSMLARNAASSRAIPFEKMQKQLNGMPVRFGKNISGMQDGGEYNEPIYYDGKYYTPQDLWKFSKGESYGISKAFADAGYHKQVFNRVTEPYQMIRGVVTGTEWANFFWLRDDDSADPTIRELARCMREAKDASEPDVLQAGDWHLPYLHYAMSHPDAEGNRKQTWFMDYGSMDTISLKDAIKVSSARCAAVSFRNEGYGLEKSIEIYDRLVGAERKHASAFGHQAIPMQDEQCRWTLGFPEDCSIRVNIPSCPETWEPGISHVDRDGQLWSAMLRGWVQYRKLIPNENYTG